MALREILLLGNPALYEVSAPIERHELTRIRSAVRDLHDTLMDFRRRHGVGRAIAAPQIGLPKRLFYIHIDKPVVFMNPLLENKGSEMMEVWDDCMCFPDLFVKVRRHQTCVITYLDLDWNKQSMTFQDSLSELVQHEYDHLNGVLAVSRAIDDHSFMLKSQKHHIDTFDVAKPRF